MLFDMTRYLRSGCRADFVRRSLLNLHVDELEKSKILTNTVCLLDDTFTEYKCVSKPLTNRFTSYFSQYIYISICKVTLYFSLTE